MILMMAIPTILLLILIQNHIILILLYLRSIKTFSDHLMLVIPISPMILGILWHNKIKRCGIRFWMLANLLLLVIRPLSSLPLHLFLLVPPCLALAIPLVHVIPVQQCVLLPSLVPPVMSWPPTLMFNLLLLSTLLSKPFVRRKIMSQKTLEP